MIRRNQTDSRSATVAILGAVLAFCAVATDGGALLADEIRLADRTLKEVKVVGYENGLIEFRNASGVFDQVEVWLVTSLSVDDGAHASDLNEAEDLANRNETGPAIDRYERAVRAARGFWPRLINARLLGVTDRAGQYEQAAHAFVDVLETDPVAAAQLYPTILPDQPSRGVNRALKRLEKSVEDAEDSDRKLLAMMLRYSLLRSVADPEWTDLNRVVATTVLPTELTNERTGAVQLRALESLLDAGGRVEVLGAVQRGLANAPDSYAASLLLLKSRALLASAKTPDDCLAAAVPAMRVAIHFAKNKQVGDALILAAEAHEAGGFSDDAVRLLREVLRREASTDDARQTARKQLARLSESSGSTG